MRVRGWTAVLGAAVLLAGCTAQEPQAPASPTPEPIATPAGDTTGTLTVWLMEGSQPQALVDRVNANMARTWPDVDIDVQVKRWDGIQDELRTALAGDDAPDVVEVGASMTAALAGEGLLADLTDEEDTLRTSAMLAGPLASGELDGARYGVPYYATVRVVAYNKKQFAKAGITKVPRTLTQLTKAAAALQEEYGSDGSYSAFYLPADLWEGAMSFVWDAGGEVAVQSEGRWTGALDSQEARTGLTRMAALAQKYSRAPEQADSAAALKAFRAGDVGMMLDWWWVPGALDGGALHGDVGAFALPGTSSSQPAPALVGGSNLAVGQRSDAKGLAVQWIRRITGPAGQTQLAQTQGVVPNQEAAFVGHRGNPFLAVADRAALTSRFTPVSPNWPDVESAGTLPTMTRDILTGAASVAEATATASSALTEQLNE